MAEATDASPAAIDIVVGMTKIVTTVMTIAPTGWVETELWVPPPLERP
jgi:hypothetical protein